MTPTLDMEKVHIAVIGLGYVGLPLAAALSAHFPVLGYDIDAGRIDALKRGYDVTGELNESELPALRKLQLSSDSADLARCNVYIVAVPTPVDANKLPDLSPLRAASQSVGRVLKRGDVVIYESTVFPGATEEICVPELERASGLAFNTDFYCGYSPERINPGDRQRRISDIVKVTSGSTPAVAEFVDQIYRRIIKAGTHLAPSIKVAEAAKAVENTQRDINIAFANELAMMFHRMGIDTEAVLKAAETKWNFMPIRPGLVGGHCIGVDPYYLIHKAEEVGAAPTLIRSAREINEQMSVHVFSRLLEAMAAKQIPMTGAHVLILGLSFKENCPDLRNTRVIELIEQARSHGATVDVHDPWADALEARREHAVDLLETLPERGHYDLVVVAVAHRQFVQLGVEGLRRLARSPAVIFDVKGMFPRGQLDGRL
ncbi:MAG: nucleotide sugar dehydrogenase [Pseudomonadota bacterium]|nr:nucleotide sugar dehydrogenase [Pseudomonadota bacterium]